MVELVEAVDDGSAGDVKDVDDAALEVWQKSGRGAATQQRLKKKNGKRVFLFMGVLFLSMGGAL
jgi:hypothetical protein